MCPVSYIFKEDIIPMCSKNFRHKRMECPGQKAPPLPVASLPLPRGPHPVTLSPVSVSREYSMCKKVHRHRYPYEHNCIFCTRSYYTYYSILHTLFHILLFFFFFCFIIHLGKCFPSVYKSLTFIFWAVYASSVCIFYDLLNIA